MGMTPEEIQRGTYELGEGITGTVAATGMSATVPDICATSGF